jgi:hypothetical protein
MDIKQLLEKMEEFAGEKVGQKSGDQWQGSDKAPPGKKLVGDSILKDLSKGKSPKSKEQELSEEFQAFLEAEFKDTVDKRPGRKSDRHSRGHEPQPRYKTVKADEGIMKEKDIELQDYRSMSHKEFQAAYGMTKTEWINKNKALVIQNPSIKKALGLEEGVGQVYTVLVDRQGGIKPVTGTMEELLHYFRHFLHQGRIYEKGLGYGVGRHKINMEPKNVQQLVDELNKAATNIVANRPPPIRFMVGKSQVAEGVPYKATNKDPASKDPIVAKVVKQMRPGLTGLDMGNEAFLYFAYELGKQRARDAWSDYLPAIRAEYEKGLNEDANTDNKLAKLLARFVNQSEGADRAVALDAIEYIRKLGHIEQFATSLDYFGVDLDEGSKEDGPVEARWMVKVSDDEGDHLKTYHRKFPSLSAAKKAYKKYEPYASDFKHKPVKKDQVEEAVGQDSFNRAGYNPIRDERDYLKKLSDLSNLSRKPGLDQQMKDQIKQRILDLNAEARTKGYIQAESRGHNVIATKLKNLERERKFASGELKIPTPQERQAQLAKQQPKKEKVDEYGADNPAQATTQKASPAQAQQVAANLNTQKTALSQLKQINPEIDPQKAAMAVTKDVATMSPQEKEELAQVAKTLSPALGTPALGSIKTAIQKSQLQATK